MASLPKWTRAYTLFRVADGATAALIPLMAVTAYGLPAWGAALVVVAMNLAGVPASYLWGTLMEHGKGRRRLATIGFAVAGTALVGLALMPAWPLYLLSAAMFTAFGGATASAAGRLIIEGQGRSDWGALTSRLNLVMSSAYMVGLGAVIVWSFAGMLAPQWVFLVSASLCVAAAWVAWSTIRPFTAAPVAPWAPQPQEQLRMERPVWFPAKLRVKLHWPRHAGPHRRLALGVAVTFLGTTAFNSSFSGVLAADLHLSVALVLLAQVPSHLAIPFGFRMTLPMLRGRGEEAVARIGLAARMLTVPAMAITILLWRPEFYWPLLALGAVMGLTFAMVQATVPCILAAAHPTSTGRGLGTYHGAVALGVLSGSSLAALVLRVAPLAWSYALAAAALVAGTAIIFSALRQQSETTTANNALAQ